MAKGSRGGQSGRGGSGRGVNPNNITALDDMIVERDSYQSEIDDVLQVSQDLLDEYGQDLPLQQFFIAELKGADANTLGFCDGDNIAINRQYLDTKHMNKAYDDCVSTKFHPSRGNKSGMQAVVAHEFGHAATEAIARKIGITGNSSIHDTATRIVNEARKGTKHRGVVQMASKISGYATHSNAEAVAEAFCDVYCNGKKAARESRAIVDVMNKYLK